MSRPEPHWGNFLEVIDSVDPQFYLRLGKVFEAAARNVPTGRFFCQFWFDGAVWLEILLQETTRSGARWSSVERTSGVSNS